MEEHFVVVDRRAQLHAKAFACKGRPRVHRRMDIRTVRRRPLRDGDGVARGEHGVIWIPQVGSKL